MSRIKARDIHEKAMEEDQEYRREYESLEQEDETLAETGEAYFLEQTLAFIRTGKNISSKDLATALRCHIVQIPKEILYYAADYIDGKRKRGKPIDVLFTSAKIAFANAWPVYIENSFTEIVRREFRGLKNSGMNKDEACESLAEKYKLSEIKISRIIYPRHKK